MNGKIISVIGFAALAFGILVFAFSGDGGAEDVRDLVESYSAGTAEAQSASISSHDLTVTAADGSETSYDTSEEEFFVSIAPYINETHPWSIHNLTGCQGELAGEEFDVLIKDTDGNIIIDETMTAPDHGFLDLWLPRNETYHVAIGHDGKTTGGEISTFEGDDTCITTMQLS